MIRTSWRRWPAALRAAGVAVALGAGIGSAGTAIAQPQSILSPAPVQAEPYEPLLDDYGWVGCATGAAMGGAAGYASLALSPWLLYWGMIGCSLGGMVGPLGLFLHDVVTGDTTFDRYFRDVLKDLEEAARPKGPGFETAQNN